jgi:hypothetical protein
MTDMRLHLLCVVFALGLAAASSAATARSETNPTGDQILAALSSHQYDLENDGRAFLLSEARNSNFFLLGELHGENEIPALLRALWPKMWTQGYRHIAAEVSPWAAYQLEFGSGEKGSKVHGLWTRQEAAAAHAPAAPGANVLWGCDMEEEQPGLLMRELATRNPSDTNLKQMMELTEDGYNRKLAPALLDLAKKTNGDADEAVNGLSLRENLLATLEIEANRLKPESKMMAQNERERLMKEQFLAHYRQLSPQETSSKVLVRFGRNHLHRGYDARGISTLGNFIAEFAVAEGRTAFNVGAFGAGGKASLLGESWDADERQDELAFALLAANARYSATVFDLRPVRALLHQIPQEKRSSLQANLIYWADSYDALICYKTVTPRAP